MSFSWSRSEMLRVPTYEGLLRLCVRIGARPTYEPKRYIEANNNQRAGEAVGVLFG